MVKCVICNSRKGKRYCLAIGGKICPLCCGRERGIKLSCPSECSFYESHESFQEAKEGERDIKKWITRIKKYIKENNKRRLEFISQLELTVFRLVKGNGKVIDNDVIKALDFVKKRLGPIITLDPAAPELGEKLLKKIEDMINEGLVFRDVAQDEIDDFIGFIKGITGKGDEPRRFLRSFAGYIRKYYDVEAMEEAEQREKEALITVV